MRVKHLLAQLKNISIDAEVFVTLGEDNYPLLDVFVSTGAIIDENDDSWSDTGPIKYVYLSTEELPYCD